MGLLERMAFRVLLAAAAVSLGCSQGGVSPLSVTEAALSSSAGTTLAFEAQINVPTNFEIATTPHAACVIRGSNLVHRADDSGIVSLYVEPTTLDVSPQPLDCTSVDGSAESYLLEIQGVEGEPSAAPPRPTGIALDPSRIRPPLLLVPQSYSQSGLIQLGFPARPDQADVDAYNTWLRLVSAPAYRVSSFLADGGERNSVYNNIWSGGELNRPGAKYYSVTGQWTVPTITASGTLFTKSSFWIGLDGDQGSADVVQDGTAQGSEFSSNHNILFYYPWIEWFPLNEQQLSMTIHPGDLMYSWVYIGDSFSDPNPNGTYAWFFLEDLTTNQYYSGGISKPSGTTFVGNIAEFIMERPAINNVPTALANFGTASMTGDYAWIAGDGSNQHTFGTDPFTTIWMRNISDNVILAFAGSPSAQVMNYAFSNYQ